MKEGGNKIVKLKKWIRKAGSSCHIVGNIEVLNIQTEA